MLREDVPQEFQERLPRRVEHQQGQGRGILLDQGRQGVVFGRHKIRLNRIDAPESDQPFGKEATAHLKSLVAGKSVRVEYSSTDQYGRVLGIVYLDGTDINLQMLRDGYAWHYKHFDSTPSYSAAELDARTAKRGLWSSPSPINPYTWRKSKR